MPNFIPFHQWKEENLDLIEELEKDNRFCDKCHGDGYCWTCGAECEDCNDPTRRLRQIYDEKKDEQVRKLKEWNDICALT